MSVVHQLKSISKERGVVTAVPCCEAAKVAARSEAAVFETMTAWYSLTTCPDCLARLRKDDPCRPAAR